MIGKQGICAGCDKDKWLTKPSKNLCALCNATRLRKEKEPKEPTGEAKVFEQIWNDSDKRSFLSDEPLSFHKGHDQWYSLFAHVLSKAQNRYPKFKLNDKYIKLLTPYEHFLFDHGTVQQRKNYSDKTGCDWNKLYDLQKEGIEEYKKLYGK